MAHAHPTDWTTEVVRSLPSRLVRIEGGWAGRGSSSEVVLQSSPLSREEVGWRTLELGIVTERFKAPCRRRPLRATRSSTNPLSPRTHRRPPSSSLRETRSWCASASSPSTARACAWCLRLVGAGRARLARGWSSVHGRFTVNRCSGRWTRLLSPCRGATCGSGSRAAGTRYAPWRPTAAPPSTCPLPPLLPPLSPPPRLHRL